MNFLLVGLLLLFLAAPAVGQESGADQPATVDLRLVIPSNADIPPQFVATVRDAEGNAVPDVAVEFTRELEFLGTRRMADLGSSSTDVGGVARLVVIPRQEQAIMVATVVGSDISERIHATFPDDRINVFFDPTEEHALLEPVRDIMPPLIAASVALLWVFVIGLVVSSVRRIRHLGEMEGGLGG